MSTRGLSRGARASASPRTPAHEPSQLSFEFTEKDLDTVDESTRLSIEAGALDYVVMDQLKDEDRFTNMGGCPVAFRASVVRIVFFKLLGTGVLCAFTAASVGTSAGYSCALCAAVNFVACVHYLLIWAWRGQVLPESLQTFASKIGAPGRDDGNDGRRLLISENAVDGLRHSDWTVTLVLMTLDMWFLAENANPSGTPLLNKFWCAALQPVIITLGTIPRFLLGECRFKYRTKGDPTSVRPWAWALGGLSYAGACAVFAVCLYSLVEFIWKDGTPPDVGMRLQDANVVTALALAQIGYPVVSLYAIIYMHCLCAKNKWRERGDTYPAMLSCNKDVAFAALDVSTKGGLALYAASRALWL